MIGVVVGVALSMAPVDPLTARIADSAAAAQALQGAFDGAWILRSASNGRVFYRLQITDPPDAGATLVGAWSAPSGETGALELTRRGSGRIDIVIDTKPPLRLTLHAKDRRWVGALVDGAIVTLTRGLATPPPPV